MDGTHIFILFPLLCGTGYGLFAGRRLGTPAIAFIDSACLSESTLDGKYTSNSRKFIEITWFFSSYLFIILIFCFTPSENAFHISEKTRTKKRKNPKERIDVVVEPIRFYPSTTHAWIVLANVCLFVSRKFPNPLFYTSLLSSGVYETSEGWITPSLNIIIFRSRFVTVRISSPVLELKGRPGERSSSPNIFLRTFSVVFILE